MGATIYYQPVKGKALSIGAPSAFLGVLTRAFGGDGARILTERDVPKLEGLAAAIEAEDQRAAIMELIDALHHHEEVRVWPEY